ncbi:MAG: hypothetical protein LBH00_03695 [Planctomycetaceae bacterium]|jgi:hypothetical protein|nr:hypothetical protein [Planctomycetaceae bacterium]
MTYNSRIYPGYLKICGQQFWEFISGDSGLSIDIIKPIGRRARERSMSYQKEYAQVVNKFTLAFSQEFCDDGMINWERLTRFVSEKFPDKLKNGKQKGN